MKVGRFAIQLGYSLIGALALISFWPSGVVAQHDQMHSAASHNHPDRPEDKAQTSALVKLVRESNERFQDPEQAVKEGYVLQFGCVSGGDLGAMGVHFVNFALVGDPAVDPTRPELLVYRTAEERTPEACRGGLSGFPRRLACHRARAAGALGTALSLLREAQSLWARSLLHDPRLGLEGEPQRHVRELEPQGFVRRLQPENALSECAERTADPFYALVMQAQPMEEMFPLVYNELRRMAARKLRSERDGHTFCTTALCTRRGWS